MNYLTRTLLIVVTCLILPKNTLLSQIDTLKLLSIINRTTNFNNAFIQFSAYKSYNNTKETVFKKVWLVKDKDILRKIRVESIENGNNITLIVNNKEKYYINHTTKRSDLTSFKLMDNKTLNDFYSQLLHKHLPSFLIYSNKSNDNLIEALKYYSNPINASIQALNDTILNNFNCFVYKITDLDPNSGYLPDYTGETDGTNAQYFVDYYFFNKTDSSIIGQKSEFYYEISKNNHSTFEVIEKVYFDNNQNESNSIYFINADTLRNSYLNSNTRYDGKFLISELNQISLNRISLSEFKIIENQITADNEFKNYILVFIDNDNEECWKNLIALKNQINNIRAKKTGVVAVFNQTVNLAYEGFLTENNIRTIISDKLFNKFVTDTFPIFALIDNNGKIIDISYIMIRDTLNKYINY